MAEDTKAQDAPSEQKNGESISSTGTTALVNGDSKKADNEPGHENNAADTVFKLDIKLPHEPFETSIMCTTREQVQDIRQAVIDLPYNFQYSCFHLEHNGKRINDFVELSDVHGIAQDPHARLVEDPYTENQARIHFLRIRDLIGVYGDQTDCVRGLKAGLSLHDDIAAKYKKEDGTTIESDGDVPKYDFTSAGSVSTLVPQQSDPTPKTLKSFALSHWNPPPYSLRAQGHLLYILITTLEGEQFHITSHVTGFYVNNSSNFKFDPSPRSVPKPCSAHSLLTILHQISPLFTTAFASLQDLNSKKDPLSAYQVSNAIPSSPWLVSSAATALSSHQPDVTRSQEPFLFAGSETAETLRDWNEEFQATRELPKDNVQDRVLRERLTSKLFAEYNAAAVKGAVLVARGEIAPLDPTEVPDAHIFVYNNVFYSFGADGVGTFVTDGGDEAARVATGKDVRGVRTVNQLDISGLHTPATVVVDYLGKRVVGQSIVPGIFKQREPGVPQIDYGGVEGHDTVARNEVFTKPFAELSKALHVKPHPVWDKEHVRHDLEGSVETKGLLGTDGRKYVLDLYRLTPLDVEWLDEHRKTDSATEGNYPHRMAVLRPELIDSFWRSKLRAYYQSELAERKAKKDSEPIAANGKATEDGTSTGETDPAARDKNSQEQERVDLSGFDFVLNPDVCCGQQAQTDEEKAEMVQDEEQVRTACKYLTETVIPQTVKDIKDGDVGFPMDGRSLTSLLHKRGINLRYLGQIAKLADASDARLQALKRLVVQEMVSRAFKHIANRHLRGTPAVFAHHCIAHLLNCLLGAEHNPEPQVIFDKAIKSLYPHGDYSFATMTPETLRAAIVREITSRYIFRVEGQLVDSKPRMLREVCLKLGLQIEGLDYKFDRSEGSDGSPTNGHAKVNGHEAQANGHERSSKKKKRSTHHAAPSMRRERLHTFEAEDIVNIVPLVKEASPKSVLAEEALEAARISINQDQKELGQELLLESLSLHEQIYGILHAEVARAYYAMSSIYYGLDEKNAAMELARKAVIIFERTLGLDHAETVLSYLNLSLFEHAGGNTVLGLAYVRHALDLWKVIYGPRHPDSITTINNGAVMLQSLKKYHDSRMWFEASLDVSTEVSGKHSANTATLLFQYAQSLALDRDPNAAVSRMREAFTIFRDELGPDDRNTKEAETWLDSLTQNAVSQARNAKALEAKGLVARAKAARTVLNPVSSTAAGRENVVRSAESDRAKSIDELLKYINAGSGSDPSPGGSKKGKKKTTVPARRR